MRISDWSSDVCSSDLAGFTRVRIDGEFYAIEEAPTLDKKYKHDIEVVVDRLVVKEGIGTRLADSFETALKLADGLAYVDLVDASVAEALQSPSDRKSVGSGTRVAVREDIGGARTIN